MALSVIAGTLEAGTGAGVLFTAAGAGFAGAGGVDVVVLLSPETGLESSLATLPSYNCTLITVGSS